MEEKHLITLSVAGKEYKIPQVTAAQEHLMRLGAEEINRMYGKYDSLYPTMKIEDKMSMVALQLARNYYAQLDRNNSLQSGLADLESQLAEYLSSQE